jgi:hypothetical protein
MLQRLKARQLMNCDLIIGRGKYFFSTLLQAHAFKARIRLTLLLTIQKLFSVHLQHEGTHEFSGTAHQ